MSTMQEVDTQEQHFYTDGESSLLFLTIVFGSKLSAPTANLRKELELYPWLETVVARHSTGSVNLRWTDFRTAVNPDLKPTRGARLPGVRRIIQQWQWLTGIPYREDLLREAA